MEILSKKQVIELISDLPDNTNISIKINEKEYLITPTGYVTKDKDKKINHETGILSHFTNMQLHLKANKGWKIWDELLPPDSEIYDTKVVEEILMVKKKTQ